MNDERTINVTWQIPTEERFRPQLLDVEYKEWNALPRVPNIGETIIMPDGGEEFVVKTVAWNFEGGLMPGPRKALVILDRP